MKYFIFFSYLTSFTFSQGLLAASNSCSNCGHKSSVIESKDFAVQTYEKKCREDFEKNQCARLNLDEDSRKKILSCTADDLDIKVLEPSKACGSDVILGLLWPVAVPFFVKGALDSDQKCFDDAEAKRATFIRYNNAVKPLLEKVSPQEKEEWGREILIPDELIEASAHYSCSEINNTLLRKQRKHDELLGKLVAKKTVLAAPTEVSPLVSIVTKSVQSFSCYRTEYKVAMACIVLGAGVAGKSISTVVKSAGSKEFERNVAYKTTQVAPIYHIKYPPDVQYSIWQKLESGKVSDGNALEKKVAQSLQHDREIESKGIDISTHDAQDIKLESGISGIWKGGGDSSKEVAAYVVDKELGLNQVPVTVLRDRGGVVGSMQLKVVNTDKVELTSFPKSLAITDYLYGVVDRTKLNYFTKDGRPITIDNGYSFLSTGAKKFPPEFEQRLSDLSRASNSTEFGKNLSRVQEMVPEKHVYEKLKITSEERWREILTPYLYNAQIDRFLERRLEILKRVGRAEEQFGDQIFPSGPRSPLVRPGQVVEPDSVPKFLLKK